MKWIRLPAVMLVLSLATTVEADWLGRVGVSMNDGIVRQVAPAQFAHPTVGSNYQFSNASYGCTSGCNGGNVAHDNGYVGDGSCGGGCATGCDTGCGSSWKGCGLFSGGGNMFRGCGNLFNGCGLSRTCGLKPTCNGRFYTGCGDTGCGDTGCGGANLFSGRGRLFSGCGSLFSGWGNNGCDTGCDTGCNTGCDTGCSTGCDTGCGAGLWDGFCNRAKSCVPRCHAPVRRYRCYSNDCGDNSCGSSAGSCFSIPRTTSYCPSTCGGCDDGCDSYGFCGLRNGLFDGSFGCRERCGSGLFGWLKSNSWNGCGTNFACDSGCSAGNDTGCSSCTGHGGEYHHHGTTSPAAPAPAAPEVLSHPATQHGDSVEVAPEWNKAVRHRWPTHGLFLPVSFGL